MKDMATFLKQHTHHVRRLRAGSRDRYECLDCGKRLRILSGIIIEKPEEYNSRAWREYLEAPETSASA